MMNVFNHFLKNKDNCVHLYVHDIIKLSLIFNLGIFIMNRKILLALSVLKISFLEATEQEAPNTDFFVYPYGLWCINKI